MHWKKRCNCFIDLSQILNEPDKETLRFFETSLKPEATVLEFSPVTENIIYENLLSIKSKSIGADSISINMLPIAARL